MVTRFRAKSLPTRQNLIFLVLTQFEESVLFSIAFKTVMKANKSVLNFAHFLKGTSAIFKTL